MALKAAGSRIGLEDRCLGLLCLQDEWVAVIAPGEQHDPGASPDAADADDLAGQVVEPVGVEQVAAIAGQAGAVGVEDAADRRLDVAAFPRREELLGADEQGRFADESQLSVDPMAKRSSARRLSLPRALATLFSTRLTAPSPAPARNCLSRVSASRRAYQMLR